MQKGFLTNENIAKSVEDISSYLRKHRIDSKASLKNTLTAEEMLLSFQEHFGPDTKFHMYSFRMLGFHHTLITVKGEPFNPLDKNDDDDESCFNVLMARMGLAPVYRYEQARNIIDIKTERHKLSTIAVLLISLILGIILGLLSKAYPSAFFTFFTEKLVSPVSKAFSSFIGAISGPVIFFTIIASIINIGDLSSLKQVGPGVLKRIFFFSFTVFILSLIFPVLNVGISETGAELSPVNLILETVFSIVPDNLISPFINGSTLQILFWGVVISIALLAVSNQNSELAKTLVTLNDVFSEVMKSITTLIPLFIFTSIYLVVNVGKIDFSKAGIIILYYLIGCISSFLLLSLITWLRTGLSPAKVVKWTFKPLMTAFLTCTSLLALNQIIDELTDKEKFNIDEKTVRFVTPLSQILFKPSISVNFFIFLLSVLKITDTPLTISMLITLILLNFIFGIATPPCAGGGIAVLAILFNTLNLDLNYLALLLSIDTLLDNFSTTLVTYSTISAVLICKDKDK